MKTKHCATPCDHLSCRSARAEERGTEVYARGAQVAYADLTPGASALFDRHPTLSADAASAWDAANRGVWN